MKRKKIPAPPVSRIGQHDKRPMAKLIKDKKPIKISKQHLTSFASRLGGFLKSYYVYILGGILSIGFVCVGLFTSVFHLSEYQIKLDEKSGCLTQSYVESYVKLHITSMWSSVFFTDGELRNIHACLDRLSVSWNPFQPKKVVVLVTARKPVLRVNMQRLALGDNPITAELMFQAAVDSEELRFMLPNGRLVQLDADPPIPEITMRYDSKKTIDETVFSQEEILAVIQLQTYIKSELDVSSITVTDTGIARFTLLSGSHVYMTLRNNLPEQLGSLQAILRASTIDRNKLLSIDVRSSNVALRYLR